MNKIKTTHKEQHPKSAEKTPKIRPQWQLALFILVVGLIYWALFNTVYVTPYSAKGIYFDYASLIRQGQVPYADFKVEYPPLALLFFILPRLVSSALPAFTFFYKAEVFLALLIGLFLIYRFARRMGKAPWKTMLVYVLCIVAIGPILAEQFDIFPAILTLGSLYAFTAGKNKMAWALLALGALTKIYPLFLAPVYLVIAVRNRQYRTAGAGILTAVLIGAVFAVPFVIMGSDSIKSLADYHLQRGIQIESTYSSFLLMGDKLGLDPVKTVFNFGSWNLVGRAAEVLSTLSGYLLMASLLIVYWFIYRRTKPGKSQSTRIGAYSLLVICLVLITSKVLSPQYLVWLIPLVPLFVQRGLYIVLEVFIMTGVVTYYLFPHAYLALIDLQTVPVIFLIIRNFLLVALTLLVVIYLHRMKASE